MPHWEAIVETSSPAILESANGDPQQVREAIMANAPAGANVRSISFVSGRNEERIVVEGPGAEDYLGTLEARDIVELVTTGERKQQRDPS